MTVSKLPNGRWRARIHHNGKDLSVAKVLGLREGTSWRTKSEAKEAKEKAKSILKSGTGSEITVKEFWERWTSDPLFARPKESTNIHNLERTRKFATRYGKLRLIDVSDLTVAEWLLGGANASTIPALRAMFNDAARPDAGRLIDRNPFAGLRRPKTKGNKDRNPPDVNQVAEMVSIARELTPPSYAAYFEFACLTGARPSELDALTWDNIRPQDGEIDLEQQFNTKSGSFTAPKYGSYTIALVEPARDLLLRLPRQEDQSPYVFTTSRGTHYTASSRIYHWNRVRCAAGVPGLSFYLATRHHFGWYALNILHLEPHVIAAQLGHHDGGKLVVELYGHPDKHISLGRIRDAFLLSRQAS